MAADRIHVQLQLARGLRCVDVIANLGLGGNAPYGFDWLQDAGLVVGHHYADQPGIGSHCLAYMFGRQNALLTDRQNIDLDPAITQSSHCVQHRVVLDRAGNNMISRSHGTENREVIAFRPAAGKNNLRRAATQKPGNACPRPFHSGACVLPLLVDRGSIPKPFQKKRAHSLQHLRQQRSGGIRVQVNSPHNPILREPTFRGMDGCPTFA